MLLRGLLLVLVIAAACSTSDVAPTVDTTAVTTADVPCVGDSCALGTAPAGVAAAVEARAVGGAALAVCGLKPLTGFVRDGLCRTGVDDVGAHTVCGVVTAEFLSFSKSRGNDLVTPRGAFAGLVPGDHWCLCESRVLEALDAGVRVPIDLAATNAAALRTLSRAQLDSLGALATTTTTTTATTTATPTATQATR